MAVMAPEVAAGAAGAVGGRVSDDLGGLTERGSPAAFMLAILLTGGALGLFWLAFHNPSQWPDSAQYPGLFGRALQWMQTAAEGPSLLGNLSTSQPAATPLGAAEQSAQIIGAIEGTNPPKGNFWQILKGALQNALKEIMP